MGSTSDTVWKVNVVGANVTIKEPQNPNDTVIFINGARQNINNTECVSGSDWLYIVYSKLPPTSEVAQQNIGLVSLSFVPGLVEFPCVKGTLI